MQDVRRLQVIQLVSEAVTGQPAGVNVFYVLANLMGADSSIGAEATTQPANENLEALFPNSISEIPQPTNVASVLFPAPILEAEAPGSGNAIDELFPDAIASAGGTTVAQDEKSSIVFGMAKEAIALQAVQHVLPIQDAVGGLLIISIATEFW